MRKQMTFALAAVLCAVAVERALAETHYTRLAYIESSGTQYIDTGYKPSKNTRTYIDYQIVKSSLAGQERVFGVDSMTISYSMYVSGTKYWAYAFKDGEGQWKNEKKNANTSRHVFDFNNGKKLTVDGGSVWNTTLDNTPTKTATGTMFLGARRLSSGASDITPHRIYACKMWESGVLVRDYVPSAYGGVTGLWDRVEGVFYGNAGTGAYAGAIDSGEAEPETNMLRIASSSLVVSSPSPSYGAHCGYVAGEEVEVSCPAVWTNEAGNVAATCTGWKLYNADGAVVDSGNTRAFTYVHPSPAAYRKIEWQWEVKYRVAATANAGGTTAPAEQWVMSGATATVTATPAAGKSFYKWTNDVPASVSALSPSISFPVSAPISLFASFGDILYVKEGGSDTNGGTSWDDAFATPEKALAVAPNGTMVVVGDGTYLINAQSLKMTNAVNMVSVNGPSVTILRAYNAGKTFATGTSSTWRWVLEMRNAEAVVDGFTLENGRRYNSSPGASGLWLYNGLVRNCVIHDCRGGMTGDYSGGGVYIANGTLADSVIHGNNAYYNNNTTGKGGGIHQSGGLVTGCVITNNGAGGYGCGIYISGGTMRNSLISRNHGMSTSYMNPGGTVYMDGGTVDSCVITGNVSYVTTAGGVYLNNAKAVLRNCLVAGNRARGDTGGVLLANGRVENCTITENKSLLNGTTGTGLRQTGGTAVNNIIYGNVTAADASDTYVSGGTFKTNVVSQSLSVFAAGDGNVAANPLFANAAAHDYRLCLGSPAIDAANPSTAVKTDLAGTARPQGAANDIGCYEYASSGAIACSFAATAQTYLDTASPTFTASVAGAAGEVSYAWYLDGVLQPSLTGATATFADIGYGRHSIKLVVTDGVTTGEFEAPGVISVVASTAYVSTTGSATFPYDTPAKAAGKLQDAINAVWATDEAPGTVIVSDGTYYPDDTWTIIRRPVAVRSVNGPATTILNARNPSATTARRVVHVNNGKAVLSGFTLTGGYWEGYAYGDNGTGCARLSAGTITNCVIKGNYGGNTDAYGGGIQVYGGLCIDCRIINNYTRHNNDSTNTRGGGLYQTAGEVAFCVISNNWACQSTSTGGGVYIKGGTLRDSLITGNYSKNTSSGGFGILLTGGTVERCVITGNVFKANATYCPANGGGVYMTGGTLRNCLVSGNKAKTSGGGIYQTGGTVEFCTVAGNTSTAKSNSGLYLNGSGAVCRYNILSGNGAGVAAEPNCNIAFTASASFATNVVNTVSGTTYGTDNIYDVPLFADAPNDDYTLSAGSPAIDAAVGADWVTNDLAGNVRPEDGDGNGAAAPDLGCYEAPDASAGALQCSFSPDSVESAGATTASFTAAASGAGSQGTLTYVWTLPGATDVTTSNGGASVTATYTEPGAYDVTLTVTAENETTATASIASCVKIGAQSIFVDASNATPVWPYATWATAATNVQDVFDTIIVDPSKVTTVTVTNGTYTIKNPYIALSFPIVLKSVNGPGATTIRAAYPIDHSRHHFYLTHDEALLTGFTLSNARADSWETGDHGASSLRISAGVVSNCVVTGAETCRSTYGAVSVSGTGLLTHSVIRNSNCNKSTSSGAAQSGAGLALSGNGVAEYCVISNCYAEGAAGSRGGGAYVMGGVLRDSSIFNCQTASSSDAGGAISQTGGLVERCVIGDSAARKNGGSAIYQTGGTMRNCLVRGFVAKSTTQVLQLSGSGSFVNNTVVTNGFGSAAASPVAAAISGGSVSNCVFALNNGGDVAQTGGTVAHSRFAEADGANGNTARDPSLRNPAKGDYTLRPGSPCRNAGSNAAWDSLAGAVDLAGEPRLFGKVIDMGCYELQVGGGTMLLLQ